MVVVAGNSNVQKARGLSRRKDREKHRNSPPIGKEVTLTVVRPWVLTERVVPLNISRECELVAVGIQLTQSDLRVGRGACRAEEMTSRGTWTASPTEGFPHVAIPLPIWVVLSTQLLGNTACNTSVAEFEEYQQTMTCLQ